MGTYIIKKNGVEIIYTDTLIVVKYENTLLAIKPRKDSELLKVLPENIQKIVKTVIERVEPVNQGLRTDAQ